MRRTWASARVSHLADGVASVGGLGVHVQIAVDIGERDKSWQRMRCGGFDLAAVLAQLGRDVIEIQRPVDVFLTRGGDDDVVFEPEQRILAECEAALDGALTQRDIVHLGARKIL
jgi:predicted Rdx family selenoprotein